MKKKLESELISIAHRILKLSGKEDLAKMHKEVAELYEKLTVLKFAKDNFEEDFPTIGGDSSFFSMLDEAFNNKVSDTIEVEDKVYIHLDENEEEAIMEPGIKTIKDMVAHMPQEEQMDMFFGYNTQEKTSTHDIDELTAGYENIPEFEPISKTSQEKTSLNDKLKRGGLNIGLNDKIAFIKHLFDGKNEDYDRVLSQINTSSSFQEAHNLIQTMVKPDYNNWEGKEEYEARFMSILESRFN